MLTSWPRSDASQNLSIHPTIGSQFMHMQTFTAPSRRRLIQWMGAAATTELLSACGGGGGSGGNAPTSPAPPPTVPPGTTVVNATGSVGSATGAPLSSRFAGLSYEKTRLTVPLFSPTNAAFIRLLQRLGPGVLRIGANGVDLSSWSGLVPGLTPITPAQIDAFAACMQAAGWQVIYGINMANNTPANAAAEASYVASRLGSALLAWEIGNEPDLYHSNGDRPSAWSYADYLSEWRTLRSAIAGAAPGVPFSGPAAAYDTARFTIPFARDAGAGVPLLTQHYYRANGQDASSTLDLLLTADAALPGRLQSLVAAARAAGMAQGFRLAECNSFYNGGAPNISNAFGTALWVLDFLFTCAINGCTGANLHGGGNGSGYTPIADSNGTVVAARPEYHGLLMFSLAASGQARPGVLSVPADFNASLWGVQRNDGGLNLLLINKDRSRALQATVNTGAGAAVATSFDPLWLTGTSMDAPTGQQLGGYTVAADGSWQAQAMAPVTGTGGSVSVTLPPATAVLLRST